MQKYQETICFSTYDDLVGKIESCDKWNNLLRFSTYELNYIISDIRYPLPENVDHFPQGSLKIIVVIIPAEGFSTAAKKVAKALSSIGSLCRDVPQIPRCDENFPCCGDDVLSSGVLSDAVNKVLSVLDDKVKVMNLNIASEYTMREFISPILIVVVLLCTRIWKEMHPDNKNMLTLACERIVLGQEAHGPVDYSILFDWFDIVLTEAKKDDLNGGIVQNYLQLKAAKQFTANSIIEFNVYGSEKKRKYEEAFNSHKRSQLRYCIHRKRMGVNLCT